MQRKTNVPDIRLAFRHHTLVEELAMIRMGNSPHISVPQTHDNVLLTADAVAARAMAKP